jgi:hypothetical protein
MWTLQNKLLYFRPFDYGAHFIEYVEQIINLDVQTGEAITEAGPQR